MPRFAAWSISAVSLWQAALSVFSDLTMDEDPAKEAINTSLHPRFIDSIYLPALEKNNGLRINFPSFFFQNVPFYLGFPWPSLVAQLVKNPPTMWETWVRSLGWEDSLEKVPGFDPWVGKTPWRRYWLPTPVFWPGEFHGLYSPLGLIESDMTERLSLTSLCRVPFSQRSI